MKNLISVIVPVYNVEKYVEECVNSLLAQTYPFLEIILVDDGSTDDSYSVCQKLSKKDKRIKLYKKSNGGLSSARNYGLSKAKGNLISFIDSDDFISLNFYEVLINPILKQNCDLSFCNYQEFTNRCDINTVETGEANYSYYNEKAFWNQTFEKANASISCNKLYKKHLFDEVLFPVGSIHEDEFVLHKIISKTKLIAYTQSALYYYRQREGSIMYSFDPIANLKSVSAFTERTIYLLDKEYYNASYSSLNIAISYVGKSYRLCRNKTKEFKKLLTEEIKKIQAISKKFLSYPISLKRKTKLLLFIMKPYIVLRRT